MLYCFHWRVVLLHELEWSPLLKYGKLEQATLFYVVIHIVWIHVLELTAVIVVRTLL